LKSGPVGASGRGRLAEAAESLSTLSPQLSTRLTYHEAQIGHGHDAGADEERQRLANTKQAIKMIRVAEKRRLRNRPIRSSVRTHIRHAREAIADEASEPTTLEAVKRAISQLDRAVSKGVIHRNNAARRKSRLMKLLNGAVAAAK
jgi:small subunit ribosomal protein S20